MNGFSFFELGNLLKGYYMNDYISSKRITDFELEASQLVKHKQHNNCFISISSNRWNKINKRKVNWVDGNQQILKHYDKCELIITEYPIEQLIEVIPQLIVKNSYEAMIILAKASRAKMKNPVIGITGSVGKSSTRLMIEHLLKEDHTIVATRGNHNTQTGVPLYGAKLCTCPNLGILEISLNALNNRGNQSLTVRPDIAIVTSIGEAHLSTLHTTKNIARFKARIFEGLTNGGIAIINQDIEQPEFEILYQTAKKKTNQIKTYSMVSDEADLYLKEFSSSKYSTSVTFCYEGKDYQFKIKMPSEGIIQNALAAFLCLGEMGYDLTSLLPKLYHYRSLPKIMQLRKFHTKDKRAVDIIDDSHNAAIPSMINAIRTFKTKQEFYKGRSILVLGQVADLGERSEVLHQTLIPEILTSGADYIFGHGPYMRNVIKQLPTEIIGGWFDNAKDLAMRIPFYCNDDSLVLLKGSVSGSDFKLTSQYLEKQLTQSTKELQGFSPNEIADVIQPEYGLSCYNLNKKSPTYQEGFQGSRAIEGLSHIIMLLLLFKKNIEPTKVSSLSKWVTNKGKSIYQKPFQEDEVFKYKELVDELVLTQHPSAIYQLASDYFGSSKNALKEVHKYAQKTNLDPSATLNLTGRYRVKEQQSYGIDDLLKIGRDLHPFNKRLPVVLTVNEEPVRGITFGKTRLSFIGFYKDMLLCMIGVKSKVALHRIIKTATTPQIISKDMIK